jgi:serine/threonine protein kinase
VLRFSTGFANRSGPITFQHDVPSLTSFDDLVTVKSAESTWSIPFKLLKMGRKIGAGGSGQVWEAEFNGKMCAVKELFQVMIEGGLDEFKTEVSALASLNHPHIVQMFGVSVHQNSVYLVVEYCPYNLQNLLDVKGKGKDSLTHTEGLEVARQVASAMQFMHCKDMSHRDLKPDNILLQAFGSEATKTIDVKVCDFGLSKSTRDLCRTGDIGTPSYMAPELLAADTAYEATKVDVWAFGVLFYYLWTRQCPYEGVRGVKILTYILDGKLLNIPKDTPIEVRDLILACWATEPTDRPAMDELVTMIAAIQEANLPLPF